MFRGINSINLDTKGRMIMPVRYRAELESKAKGQLIVTIDAEEECLLLYPLPMWEEIEKKIENLPSFNPITRRIQRLLIGHATELEMDSNGRLLLPQLLREYASISKYVMLIGQGKKFEVWDKKIWTDDRAKWLSKGLNSQDALPSELQLLSL
ncbi:MAG: division/cell wall cluster transcriptional repressor MraZ [Coxiellaceae bacterium]|jgi:MraZ protein|nr:division/cell wall cluster transcriptional repressor MraZ [Coxiellaceae bacterium]